MKRGEPLVHTAGERDDLLAFVAVERLAELGGRLVALARGFEHLGEVGVSGALVGEAVGP
jgi:hypothetical protein